MTLSHCVDEAVYDSVRSLQCDGAQRRSTVLERFQQLAGQGGWQSGSCTRVGPPFWVSGYRLQDFR